jgi:hypothetical protein
MRAFVLLIAAFPLAAAAQDYPDWSGQWTKPRGVGNNWIFDRPAGRGQQAPLIPEYQAIFDEKSADPPACACRTACRV